ncbi:glycoside hydrolase family 47 protein [Baudoinia panamericana UAMH 10762]|uniref:alpha-1,2-Mannosidase n=1 Tax=Baudoinia panamericana (strain UAMH 10762) TaxID=717646 RepID=M2M4G4_BAUPA|nr:glycoside hydrolase family 47 protein [Baudoinia panamericana UAMH 10762]EMC91481.1 glycoside hydrolase family 47 protein [Baudoinia panamericana UAMH 10762]
MYKDKPFQYPAGRRKGPWFLQRRVVALVLVMLAGLSWWFGLLSPLSFATHKPKSSGSSKGKGSWNWLGETSTVDWDARAEKVKEAFKVSFEGYEKHAWGDDEYHPLAKNGRKMTQNGLGWIIIDALDTMMLMNLTTELEHARQWIHHNLTYDQDHDVNTFETTIRMMGGLLSAHYLSTSFPDVYAPVTDDLSPDMYIEKATDLADRLLGAFETASGVPLASVNLHTMQGIPSHADAGASSTAEATSVQLELKYLAKLTGEIHYWEKAEHVMDVVDANNMPDGLLPIFIYADQGTFRGNNIRLGSRGDSYYEYLIKQYLQTDLQEPVYQAMWNESLAGIKKHLLTYSSPSNFTVLAERPNGLDGNIEPKMDHLVCFMPGTIALATTGGMQLDDARELVTWTKEQEEDIRLAEELMKTCWGMYTVTPTGLAGEITYFNIHDPPLMYEEFTTDNRPKGPASLDSSMDDSKRVGTEDYVIHTSDQHNLQRPETVESLFYMWRITGDEKYREWGWRMFESFAKYTITPDGTGYSSIDSVMALPPPLRDNMESFWLAETLKYFYLLFSSPQMLPLTDVVFNTEAHPFPRFPMGKLFKTGWQRKPRDKEGKVIQTASVSSSTSLQGVRAATESAADMHIQTVLAEQTSAIVETVASALKTAAQAVTQETSIPAVADAAAAVLGAGSVAGEVAGMVGGS